MSHSAVEDSYLLMIPFNYPYLTGKEFEYIKEVLDSKHLSGDGKFSKLCQEWLEQMLGCKKALLTPSGTAALEMSALLLDIKPGDEVIMPSFTFVSTANAFALRGAKIVFVDIRADSLNIDENQIAAALSEKTKAVVPVHYAGIGCNMDAISKTCSQHSVAIIEDAAHAIMSNYDNKPLGTFGSLSALSFHETKNLVAGEAGALIINDEKLVERAEIIREKGTNRSKFFRGQIDKYTWQEIGSSYLPSELQAAFLWAQMQEGQYITSSRQSIWELYHSGLEGLEIEGMIRRPIIPEKASQNGHIYYILVQDLQERQELMQFLLTKGIASVFHYVPLHSAPGAKEHSTAFGDLPVTSNVSERLLRLPLSVDLTVEKIAFVTDAIKEFYGLGKRHAQLASNQKVLRPL